MAWPTRIARATAALNRWTNVPATLRRFLVGVLIGRILPEALQDIRDSFGAGAFDLEAQLAAVVAQNADDWVAKTSCGLSR